MLERFRERARQKLLDDFGAFCRRAWREIEPGPLLWNWHHEAICEYLQLCHEREITRMIFCLPPRGLKSKLVSVFFGAWCWAKTPGESFILTSYSDSLSEELNMARRTLLMSSWFQTTFPGKVLFTADQNRREQYRNMAGGVAIATSTEGTVTGKGADYLLVDDLLSPQQSFSDRDRQNANRFFDSTLRSRLNEPTRGCIIIVCQRLHEADLPGYLAESEPGAWQVLNLPMEAEQDEDIVFPISGRIVHRKAGDLLHPQRWPKAWVDKQKKTLGRIVWSSQYQQRPSPKEGNLVKVSDICFYGGKDLTTGERDPDLPEEFERTIISVDCAFKDKSTSDYVAILVIGVIGSRRYVRHITNAHLNLDGTEAEIRAAHQNFGPVSCVLVEDKANGSAVIAHLTEELSGVIAVNPEGGKFARMMAAAPEFEAHNWFFDRTGAWTSKAVDQLCLFPNAKNDDIADAVSQAAIWLQANSYELGLVKLIKEVAAGTRKIVTGVVDRLRGKRHGAPLADTKPTITVVDNYAASKKANDPCPNCKNTSTIPMSAGIGGLVLHCNNCGADDGVLPAKPAGQCCSNFLPQPVGGGGIRCGNCGAQSGEGATVVAGCTFAQLEALRPRGGTLRGFGRF